ncbi:MAG: SprT-like domain-containing protein [Acidimicrobiia bacterium]
MRLRERERVERAARALVEEHAGSELAEALLFVWARTIPGAYAMAWYDTSPREAWIMFDEGWMKRASARKRREIIAHEVAHLLAYHFHGEGIQAHGPEWRRWTVRLHGKPLRA